MASTVDVGLSKIQGICPTGWHLPSTEETSSLITALSTTPANHSVATGVVPLILKSGLRLPGDLNTTLAQRMAFVQSLLSVCDLDPENINKPGGSGFTPNHAGFNWPLIGQYNTNSEKYANENMAASMHSNYIEIESGEAAHSANTPQIQVVNNGTTTSYNITNGTSTLSYRVQASVRCVADRD